MDIPSPAASAGTPAVCPARDVDVDATCGRRRDGFADMADVDAFVEMLGRFERGEITAAAWRSFSHLRGVYEQRQETFAMLRAKVPQGVLDAAQLRALAVVAELFSRGFCHVTTRQNVQFHFVRAADLGSAMRVLADAGVTTRAACGNSVRNVTACPLAGVAGDEAFDVTPYAEAATRQLLEHPLASSLPRKFKIAFEGCAEDHVATAIHDLGFRARVQQRGGTAVRGFEVVAGGGTGTVPVSARTLFEFLPASGVPALLDAMLRVFDRLGERVNRQSSRLKFLVRKMGWQGFREEVEAELASTRVQGAPALPFDPEQPPAESAPDWIPADPPAAHQVAARVRETALRGPGLLPVVAPEAAGLATFESWLATNVRRQRQAGFAAVTVTLPLGDITADQLRVLADLACAHGDGTVRATPTQDLLLRWIPQDELPDFFRRLAAAGLGKDGAGTAADVVSCPGAESCALAVTRSRGMARLVQEHLRSRPDLVAATGELAVNVSGCPSGCSQHHVAGIGLQGSARKLGGKVVAQYFVLLGGGSDEAGARFGRLAAKIPARRVPEAVSRLLELFVEEGAPGERADEFLARVPLEHGRAVLRDLAELTESTAAPEDFVEPGEAVPDMPAGTPARAEEDCAA